MYLLDYPQDKHEYRDLLKEARSMAVKSTASVIIRKIFGVITDLNRLSEIGKITGKPSNEISPVVLQLAEFVKNHDIDQIYDTIAVQMGINDSIMTGAISQSDWQAMVRILQCSPSAMDTVLNQTSYNPVLLAVSTLRYYTQAILKDPAKMALINDISAKQNGDFSKADAIAAMKLLMDFSKINNSAPIINILLAEMTRDYHKGCLAKTPFSVRAVRELFEPQSARGGAMNPLLIQGFGININVDKRRLIINDPYNKKITRVPPTPDRPRPHHHRRLHRLHQLRGTALAHPPRHPPDPARLGRQPAGHLAAQGDQRGQTPHQPVRQIR